MAESGELQAAAGKRRAHRVECVDWHIDVEGTTLRFTPSGATIARQLWATLLAAILIGVMIFWFGLPPGSTRVKAQQREVEKLEQSVKRAEKRASRIASSTSGTNSPVYESAAKQVEMARDQLDRAQEKLAGIQPTLGSAGDAAYWIVMALIALLGLFFPLIALVTRVRLSYEGPPGSGSLIVYERDVYPRIKQFPAEHFLAMGIHIQRIVTYSSESHSEKDHGWMWTIVLLTDPRDANARDLHVSVELHPTLPSDSSRLTSRVRKVVRFLEAVTVMKHQPPTQTDVLSVSRGLTGTRYKMRTRRHVRADTPS